MKKTSFGLFLSVIAVLSFVLVPIGVQAEDQARGDNEYLPSAFDSPAKTFPIMRPDAATIKKWHDRTQKNPRAHIDERFHKRPNALNSAASGFTSANILGNLTYSPSESQGSCGNCYAWAAHRVMGIDLKRQKAIAKNLSIQYMNSCDGTSNCCGGWLADVTDFYNSKKKALPNTNTNAGWKDGSRTSCASGVSCSNISTSPNYPITSISPATITTTGVSQAQAIANIKNVINQGKAIWLAFYLPTSSAWSSYNNFWSSSSESTVWNPDNYCGQTWSSYGGGGHAVTIVGYDDSSSSTANHYWIVLNSWGTTANRPKGTYRQKMYVNHACTFSGLGTTALTFQTTNISWNISSSSSSSSSSTSSGGGDTTKPTVTAFTIPSSSSSLTVSISSFTATDSVGVTGYMVKNSSTIPAASQTGWLTSKPTSYTFSSTTAGSKTLYAFAKDAAGNVSSAKSASVRLNMADLIISSVSNSATTITSSTRTFKVTDKVKNQGNVTAGASTTRYYLSTTTSKTSSSVLLGGTRSIASLSAGSSSASGSTTLTVPSGTAKGTYYVIAAADNLGKVTECSDKNNYVASSSKITVNY